MVRGSANHLFIRLHNAGDSAGTAMAKASSLAGDQCRLPPPCQLLAHMHLGLSTPP
jgi:hypothetical protein